MKPKSTLRDYLLLAGSSLLALSSASAQSTWNGSGNDFWSNAANWDTALANGNALTFSGTANQTNTNDTALTNIGLLTLTGANWDINLGTLTLNSGITASGTSSLSGALTLGGAQTWQNSTGLLTIAGTVANAGNLLTVGGAGSTTIESTIIGTGGLTKSGSGTLTLSGANTYTGPTIVEGGTLNLTGTRPAVSGEIDVRNGATLGISNGGFSIGDETFYIGRISGTSTVNHMAGTISTGTGGNQLLIGNGANGGGIYNLSGGILNINSTSNNRGIILGVNTNNIGATFNLSGTGVLNMVSTSSLQIGRSDFTASNTTNAFNQTGGTATIGVLRMCGSSTGSTGVKSTLNLTGGTFTANSFTNLAHGGTNTALIHIGGTADVTLPAFPTAALGSGSTATIEFDGGVLKNSAASNDYLGNISSAQIKDGGATFNTTAGNITITQSFQDFTGHNGSLTKEGTNTLTLSGASGYTGNTNINTGALALASTGSISDSAKITVGTGATFDVSAISGGWELGTGQTLTGNGGVTGAATINGTHAPGTAGSAGSQAFSAALNYGANSVFEWDLTQSSTSSGFDTVSATGNISVSTTDTIFRVMLSGDALDDIQNPANAFWNTPFGTQTWAMSDIFGKNFTSGAFQTVETSTNVSAYGSFSISGSSLTWTAIPEPSTALAGVLLALGLLRRRRAW